MTRPEHLDMWHMAQPEMTQTKPIGPWLSLMGPNSFTTGQHSGDGVYQSLHCLLRSPSISTADTTNPRCHSFTRYFLLLVLPIDFRLEGFSLAVLLRIVQIMQLSFFILRIHFVVSACFIGDQTGVVRCYLYRLLEVSM
ncbi:hypothetical protein K2173_019255 [Erythroxylum novogranatense]|uniref:Uncharacterized protein n=1 Tax=Erythroxylum novogranatense TaxID=1862640 RepID=A0AAV8ST35_9ROSI|nr:hypothetical protein K2173_019255 [Erythroxylum novogranatense]